MLTCDKIRGLMLLADAGEAAPHEMCEVEAHVAACAACRDFRADSRLILEGASAWLAHGEPGAPVLAAIREAAAQDVARRARQIEFRRVTARFLAYAAAILLMLGAWAALQVYNRSERLEQWATLIRLSVDPERVPEGSAKADEKDRIKRLAGELMRIEGFEDAPSFDALWINQEPTPREAPLPKESQSRNSVALRPSRYG